MSQNITLLGASYTDVPSVQLPKTGGGMASFDDTTDADATASDILTGKTAYVNGVKLTGTGSGGSATTRYITLFDNEVEIISENPNYIWINNQPEAITVGDRYRVTWNNVAYTVTAVNDATIGDWYGNTFGNASILGGATDPSNAPFVAYKTRWSTNEMQLSTNATGTIDLKIEKVVYGDNLTLQSKTITTNGTYTADSGYDALESVTVNVSGSASWATGTFTPSSATTSVTFDTTLSTIHGILIVPTSATPFSFSARTQVGMIVTPDCYYQSISLHSNQGGTGFQTPTASTTNSRMTQDGTSVTITAPYNFRTLSYTWFAW